LVLRDFRRWSQLWLKSFSAAVHLGLLDFYSWRARLSSRPKSDTSTLQKVTPDPVAPAKRVGFTDLSGRQ
jgi:hypothetical protein